MPTAQGTINSNGKIFQAHFVIDDIDVLGAGSFKSVKTPAFISKKVTLTYSSKDDLSQTWDFAGAVGIPDLTFTFQNGPVMTGILEAPFTEKIPVTGLVMWSWS
ncbi:hypothetical protein B0H34DRAFT_672688 [Crassisporium funariophilum]|nr:hypothetical protein B0H34DRAFT_672688 [Crassisporium funariophilum]